METPGVLQERSRGGDPEVRLRRRAVGAGHPGRGEQGSGERSRVQPGRGEQGSGERSRVQPGRGEQGSGERSRVQPGRGEQGSGERSRVQPGRGEQGSGERSRVQPGRGEQGSGERSRVQPGTEALQSGERSRVQPGTEALQSGERSRVQPGTEALQSGERSRVQPGTEALHAGVKSGDKAQEETLMLELSRLVQEQVTGCSWWELRGKDCTILGLALLALAPGFVLLSSSSLVLFSLGLLVLGVIHAVVTVKGAHLSSHSALTGSSLLNRVCAVFFIEVCGAFSADAAVHAHIKLHHAHTNVLGLGDSSIWKVPGLSRGLYLFIAPLAVPVITPLVALAQLKQQSYSSSLRTLLMCALGLGAQLWILMTFCGFHSVLSALGCMFCTRNLFSVPYIHVNIFQHIGLSMFSPERRPKRIYQMSHGVLNLNRNLVLDWTFGHSLISCHIEHHLFPKLSDNMCLKVKPVVRHFLKLKSLPYQQDSYLSRLRLFFDQYHKLMVLAPPISELVGVQ